MIDDQQAVTETTLTAEPDSQTVEIARTFDAPRERVFGAYTDPALLSEWWGPRRYSTAVDEMDVRPGGIWRFLNHDGDGNEYAFHGVYHDIVEPERIVQTFEFEGAPGHVQLETATFDDQDGKTRLTVRSVFQSVADRDATLESGMEDGARETWERFAEVLASMEGADEPTTTQRESSGRNITVDRVIAAPPERVYEAFLDPDQLAQWLPPTGFSAEVHELVPEVGGAFRVTFTGDTEEFAEYDHSFGGTYEELKPGKRIVYTDAFETDDPAMAGEMLVTVTFAAVPNGTEVTVQQEGIPEAIPPEDAKAGWTDSLNTLANRLEED